MKNTEAEALAAEILKGTYVASAPTIHGDVWQPWAKLVIKKHIGFWMLDTANMEARQLV